MKNHMLLNTACSELSSGNWLKGTCCDGLKSGGMVSYPDSWHTYDSCADYVNNGEYVAQACPQTCKGKPYQTN